jgi:hypothetical protein
MWFGQETVNLYLLCFRLQLTCHLLPASCCFRLFLLQFTEGAFTPTYCSRLCLFRVLSGTCLSPFLQCGVLPACYSCSPCLFKICVGNFPSPTLQQSVLHVSQCCKPSSPKAHWGGCQTHFLWQACLFRVCSGNFPSPTLWHSVSLISHCCKPCPPQAHWQELPNLPSLAGLFIYSLQGCLPLLLQSSRCPALFSMCLFQFFAYYSVFFFFLLWGRGQSVLGAMLVYLRGGCGSTMCCLFAHL